MESEGLEAPKQDGIDGFRKSGALLAPAAAFLTFLAVWQAYAFPVVHALVGFLAVLSAGSALVLSAPDDSAARKIFLVLVGFLSGAFTLPALSNEAVLALFLLLLLVTLIRWFVSVWREPSEGARDTVSKVRLTCGMTFGFAVLCWAAFYEFGQILLSYPFACAALRSAVPGRRYGGSRARAWDAGLEFAIKSMVLALGFGCLLLLAIDTIGKAQKVPAPRMTEWLIGGSVFSLVPGHAFFLFRALREDKEAGS